MNLSPNKLKKVAPSKRLIVFDLDGTLAETKSSISRSMNDLIGKLLKGRYVAVIGGGKYGLFKEQLLSKLSCSQALLSRLFLFPTTATSFYRHRKGWENVYTKNLSKKERAMIRNAFDAACREIHYVKPKKTYGKVMEDRGTQVTFSLLGQDVVRVLGKKGVMLKKKWRDEHSDVKFSLARAIQRHLPNLEVRAAGYTSIDVTRKGIDKAYGIQKIEQHLRIPRSEMLFVGDAIYPGGNDYAVVKAGVDYVKVAGPRETEAVIRTLLRP